LAIFTLRPAPPFRLDLTVWALRRLPINEMDRWDGETYRRLLVVEDAPVAVAVTQVRGADAPLLRVATEGLLPGKRKASLAALLEKMLGLRADLSPFYRMAARDATLAGPARRFTGMRPPRFPSVFEALLNGFACQQLSLLVGITLLNRLTNRFGMAWQGQHAVPRPQDLLRAKPRQLRAMGYSSHKAGFILGLARRLAGGGLDTEKLSDLPDSGALERLLEMPGVGRWTAEYVLLRGLGRTHFFPVDDSGARKSLQRLLRLRQPLDDGTLQRTLDRWRPYGGLVFFHLLLDKLAEAGILSAVTPPLQTGSNSRGAIVLTIGHSTRTLEEFIGLLRAHGASRVVDVRTVPRSRHNPQFDKTSLPEALKKAGLKYVHMPGLGGLRHARSDSHNMGWRNASFRGFADYMQTPEFKKNLVELTRLAKQDRIALMCAEAVPWRCHRSLIADALLARGIRTEDIMSPTRRQVHTLTPFAKVRGAVVTYPAEAGRNTQEKPSARRRN
jgi:DNA-3-methyladenine glycosylase II